MAKRRRGSRTARPRALDIVRSTSSSAVALDAIPEPFASALDEVAIVIADEPIARSAARERDRRGRHALRPVRGRAADRMGCRLGADARTGSRSFGCRSRRTSPTRTTSPTRSGSRSSTSSPTTSASTTTDSTSSASTDRQSDRSTTKAREADQPGGEADEHRDRQPAEPSPARPDCRWVAIASRAGRGRGRMSPASSRRTSRSAAPRAIA